MTQIQDKKVALVTGGSGGIGRGIVQLLAEKGMRVAFVYAHSKDKAQALEEQLTQSGLDVKAFHADLSQLQTPQQLFAQVLAHYGRVDCLINNAGVIRRALVADITQEEMEAVFNVNVRAALFLLQEAAKHLHSNGRIVNISSQAVISPIAGSALYTASKASLEMFGKALSREIGERGITVNSLRVGATVPGMFEAAPPERQAYFVNASPFNRLGTPEDIARVIAFLVSPEAQWVTGQVITVDGGVT